MNNKIIILLFLTLNILIYPIELLEIKGIQRLSDYEEIKNIEVERVFEKRGNTPVFNRINGLAYPKNENKVFSGVLVWREKGSNITGLYRYINGKNEGIMNDYYENGQLSLKSNSINDKIEGEGFEYYPNGKLKEKRFYKNNIIVESTSYHQNGKLWKTLKSTGGLNAVITGYYDNGTRDSTINVIQDYSKKGEINYIKNGESIAYEKNGKIWGILNYKNGKMYGLPQKLFKNGNLKYEYVAASEKGGSDFEAMTYFKEYFDSSDKLKLDCDEHSKGRWHCKEYNKNG